MKRNVAVLLTGLMSGILLPGCGGGDDAPLQAVPSQPKQQVSAPVPVAVKKPPTPAKKAPPKSDKQKSQAPQLPPGTDPQDVFAIVPEVPNFVIVGPAPEVNPQDTFHVSLPPESHDSSTFSVTLPAVTSTGTPNPGFQLPPGFQVVAAAGYSETGLPRRIRCTADQSEMVLVPSGVYPLGKANDESAGSPPVMVYHDPFYIDVHEVTLRQYEVYRQDMKNTRKRIRPNPVNAGDPEDFPALGLNWGEARSFARWAGRDLPTEAQWEAAGRTELLFDHPWGNGRAVWRKTRRAGDIDPVKSWPTDRSVFGVWDLAGNAAEWCRDWHSPTAAADAARSSNGPLENWEGPRSAKLNGARVVKGDDPQWNLWGRRGVHMSEHNPKIGFRCVLAIGPLPEAPPSGNTAPPVRSNRRDD